MESEILSIETVQKLARLEKVEIENKQYEKIICDFDREVNRLFNIIKDAYEYLDKKTLCFKDDKDILKRIIMDEERHVEIFSELLRQYDSYEN